MPSHVAQLVRHGDGVSVVAVRRRGADVGFDQRGQRLHREHDGGKRPQHGAFERIDAAGCPILVGGRVWGGMVVARYTDEPLPRDTEARITRFTDLVATAIANAEAREELAGEE